MKKLILLFIIIFTFAYSGDNWKTFVSKTGSKSKVFYNQKGKVKYLINSGVFAEYKLKVNKQNAENVVDQFFERNKELFKLAKKDRIVTKVKQWKTKTHVFVNQRYKGIPVWASRTTLTFDNSGKLLLCNSRISELKDLEADPVIPQEEAILIAGREISALNPIIVDTAALYFYHFEDKNGEPVTHLVWNFSLFDENENSNFFLYFVDAISGNIIERRSKVKDYGISGYVKGKVKPYHWDDTADDVFLSDADVAITFSGNPPYVVNTNDNGYYYKSANPYQNVGLTFMLRGPYFQFASGEGYQEYSTTQWGQTQYTYNFGESEAVNTFYHLNEMQKFFTSTPINYPTMNGVDIAVKIKYSDTSFRGAFGPFGSGLEIQIGRKDGKEWGNLADVAYHEYTHAVIYKTYGNHSIEDIAPTEDSKAASGMDEGIPDYFACSKSGYDYVAKFVTGIPDLPRQLINNGNHYQSAGSDHYNGTVIGGACRDLRVSLDNNY